MYEYTPYVYLRLYMDIRVCAHHTRTVRSDYQKRRMPKAKESIHRTTDMYTKFVRYKTCLMKGLKIAAIKLNVSK